MAVDRSKFRPTKVGTMKKQEEEVESMTGSNRDRAGMLKIENGKNKFRIYPAHPEPSLPEDEQPSFSQPSVKTFLPMMVDERDDNGKPTGEKKEAWKPIFNSRIHGGTEKDLVEEFIKLGRYIADSEMKDQTQKRQEFLDQLYGKYAKKAENRRRGIQYKTAHVLYADKITGDTRLFGRLEIKDSIQKEINRIASEESDGEPIDVDPYTDLDDGRCIVINYNKDAEQASDYYKVALDTDLVKGTKQIKLYPINDDLLEKFAAQPSLLSTYKNVFTKKDFLLQAAGLEYFDKKFKMGIWDREEWKDIYQEIAGYFSGERDEVEEDEEIDEESADQFDEMNREELKAFNKQNSLGIVVTKSWTDDMIREEIRKRTALEEEEVEEEEENEVEEEESEVEPEVKEEPKKEVLKGADRLKALRTKKK